MMWTDSLRGGSGRGFKVFVHEERREWYVVMPYFFFEIPVRGFEFTYRAVQRAYLIAPLIRR